MKGEQKHMKFIYDDGGRSQYYAAKDVGDCATRAIANATGCDYQLVYKALSKLAGKPVRNGCPKNADRKLLTMLGWKWTATMTIGSGCKVHLVESELPRGSLVVAVSGHLTCVDNGMLRDTYDCSRGGERCVYGYWQAPTTGFNNWIGNDILMNFISPKKPVLALKPKTPAKNTASKKKRHIKPKKRVSEATKIKRLEKRVEKLEELIKSLLK